MISDGPGDYAAGSRCEWMLRRQMPIVLLFNAFDTERNFDFVKVPWADNLLSLVDYAAPWHHSAIRRLCSSMLTHIGSISALYRLYIGSAPALSVLV